MHWSKLSRPLETFEDLPDDEEDENERRKSATRYIIPTGDLAEAAVRSEPKLLPFHRAPQEVRPSEVAVADEDWEEEYYQLDHPAQAWEAKRPSSGVRLKKMNLSEEYAVRPEIIDEILVYFNVDKDSVSEAFASKENHRFIWY